MNIFWDYLACINFFSFNFPLREYFFVLLPPFVKVAQCHLVRFCHLHALNRMKDTAKIKMGFMLKLMQY